MSAGEHLNTALLETGVSGPPSPVKLTPGKGTLALEWMTPGPKYFISWKGVSVKTEEKLGHWEELREEEEALVQEAQEAFEEGQTAKQEELLEEAKLIAEEATKVKNEIKEEEKENTWAKQVKIEGTEKCSYTAPCSYTVEGLVGGQPYEVRLKKEETAEEEGGTLYIPGTPE
jgi:hypothetical protein